MEFLIEEDYESLSRRVCDILMEKIRNDPCAVIVLPTGNSPLGAYRLFVKAVKGNGIRLDKVTFIQLDEWEGLDNKNPASCGYYLQKELLGPLEIPSSQFIAFRGEAENPAEECKRVETLVNAVGEISLVMLGVGKNGHIGLNEPGADCQLSAHPVCLTEKTLTHSMLAGEKIKPAQGMTLGIGTFFQAKEVLLIAAGHEKEEVISYFWQDRVSTQNPASLLQLHTNTICIVGKELYTEAKRRTDATMYDQQKTN